jgi:hypothetical protein
LAKPPLGKNLQCRRTSDPATRGLVASQTAVAEISPPGITVRFPESVRERVKRVAEFEHRSTAAYIEQLVEQDLRRREEDERIVRVYVSADAPEWGGTVLRGEGETEKQHAERTAILNQLFGTT